MRKANSRYRKQLCEGKGGGDSCGCYGGRGTISTQYSALVLLLAFYWLPYLLFAGDKGDDKEDRATTANDEDVRGEEATTDKIAPTKKKGKGVHRKEPRLLALLVLFQCGLSTMQNRYQTVRGRESKERRLGAGRTGPDKGDTVRLKICSLQGEFSVFILGS